MDCAKISRIHETYNIGCCKMFQICLIQKKSEVKDTLWSHVEQQVKDREVRQKAVFLLIHLVVGFWLKVWVFTRMLRIDGKSIVVGLSVCHGQKSLTVTHLWLDID